MRKHGKNIVITLVSLILGIALTIQFKTINKQKDSSGLPIQRTEQMMLDLKKAEEERKLALKSLEEAELKLSEYEKETVKDNVYSENIFKELEKYKTLSGYTSLKGPGIKLTISEAKDDLNILSEQGIVDDLDLILQVISVLNASEAEAISINNQRYTSFTEVERAGEHIEVNGVSIGSPITISAIGNQQLMESALSLNRGIIWTLKYYDYDVSLERKSEISIPKYNNIKEFKYSLPAEKEDEENEE